MAYPELSWANIVLGKQVVVGSTPISRSTFSDTELPPDGELGGFSFRVYCSYYCSFAGIVFGLSVSGGRAVRLRPWVVRSYP